MLKSINDFLGSIQAQYAVLITFGLFLIGACYKFIQWWNNKPVLKITPSIVGENTTNIHALITVEVVNNGKKAARIKHVYLVGALSPTKGNIEHTSHIINLPQKEEMVELTAEGGMKKWRCELHCNPPFQYYIKNGIKYGMGFVVLTSGKMIEFKFELPPDELWESMKRPSINQRFAGGTQEGHKCSKCGFIFLVNHPELSKPNRSQKFTVSCPNRGCGQVDYI